MSSVTTHKAACIAAFIAIVALGIGPLTESRANAVESQKVEIGLEHEHATSLTIDVHNHPKLGLVDIKNASDDDVFLSVPTVWTRREVRGTTLELVQPQEIEFGFTRWSMPPHATVSFHIPYILETILMHNASEQSLKVTYTVVEAITDEVKRDVVLIQEGARELW